jgi:DNA repair protein RecO (recombination protein O)
MLVSTESISLNYVKYSETSIIVKCYTKSDGIKSYLLKGIRSPKKKSLNIGLFQPLTILEIDANHKNRGNLEIIRSAKISRAYKTIHLDVYKNSMVLFLSEILSKTIKEEEANIELFNFIKNSMIWLDTSNNFSNFHIHFLVKLLPFLGILPEKSDNKLEAFNMIAGIFCEYDHSEFCINGKLVQYFKSFLGTEFDDILIEINSITKRRELIEFLIKYMQIHIPNFNRPKSINILYELFQ